MKNKSRLITLLTLLISETDENHTLTTNELIEILKQNGFFVNRKTLSDDIQCLIDTGFDIICVRKKENTYYLSEVLFDYVELKIIIDAVIYCNNISIESKQQMINKLLSLVSKHYNQISSTHLELNNNDKSIYTVNELFYAMMNKYEVTFQMQKYKTPCEREIKDDGYTYRFHPYNFIWNDNNYYVFGYSQKHLKPINIRVDRICNVKVTEEIFKMPKEIDVDKLSNQRFHMFPGENKLVTLFCEESVLDNFVDKFGEVKEFTKTQDGFIIDVKTDISPTFFGWVTQFGGKIKIISPEDVKGKLKLIIQQID